MNEKKLAWWEKEPLRIIEVSRAFEDLSKVDIKKEVAAKALLNGNIEHLPAIKHGPGAGLTDKGFYFKTRLARQENPDYLRKYLPEAKKVNLRSLIYFNVHSVDPEFAKKHPDWLQIKEDGNPIDDVYKTGMSFCINTGFRDWCFQLLKDLCAYNIDGIFYDGPIFFRDSCYCDSCRAKFKKLYSKELPSKADKQHPDFPFLLDFQSKSLADFLRDSNHIIKSINNDMLMYMNSGLRAPNWPTGRMNRVLIKAQDILGSEGGFLYGDLRNTPLWKPGCEAKLLETQANGKPRVVFDCIGHKPWTYPLPEAEIKLLYADSLANGANAWLAMSADVLQEPEVDAIKEINRIIAKNPSCFAGTESIANIALVWSNVTANYYEGSSIAMADFTGKIKGKEIGDLGSEFNGFYDALLRSHSLFDVIDEVSLEEPEILKQYQIIILPNIACLNKESVKNLQEFVKGGKRLITTFETSLYDEQGRRLKNFQLADVFGVNYKGNVFGPMNWDYITPIKKHKILTGITKKFIPAPTYGINIKAETAQVLMRYRERRQGCYDGLPAMSIDPAIVINNYGKGKAVYIAGTWGNSTWKFRFVDYHRLINNMISSFSTSLVALSDVPESLEITLRKNKDEKKHIVHLVNFTGRMSRPIKKVLPCYDVKIAIKNIRNIKTITTLASKKNLKFKEQKNGATFSVPKIEEYEVVVIDGR